MTDIDTDVLSPRALARLAKLKPESLPAVRGTPRIGPCIAHVGNFIAVGLNLRRPCGRVRHAGPQGAGSVQQGPFLHCRAERRRHDS